MSDQARLAWYNQDFPPTRSSAEVPEPQSKSIPEVSSELWSLTKTYAKQETVDPLKGVGRYLAFGAAGALLIGFGVVLLMLAALRALQTQTGTTFTGSWSWLPYVIVLVVAAALVALAVTRITKTER
jgi:Putative Actinobacterial Holin-X, holin superfamily III